MGQHAYGPTTSPQAAVSGHLLFPQKFGLDSSEDLTFGLVCIVLLDFLYLLIASACLGMAFGLVTAYCLRAFDFHHVSQVGCLTGWPAASLWAAAWGRAAECWCRPQLSAAGNNTLLGDVAEAMLALHWTRCAGRSA